MALRKVAFISGLIFLILGYMGSYSNAQTEGPSSRIPENQASPDPVPQKTARQPVVTQFEIPDNPPPQKPGTSRTDQETKETQNQAPPKSLPANSAPPNPRSQNPNPSKPTSPKSNPTKTAPPKPASMDTVPPNPPPLKPGSPGPAPQNGNSDQPIPEKPVHEAMVQVLPRLAVKPDPTIIRRPDYEEPKTELSKIKYQKALHLGLIQEIPPGQGPNDLVPLGLPVVTVPPEADFPEILRLRGRDQSEVVDYVRIDDKYIVYSERFKKQGDYMPMGPIRIGYYRNPDDENPEGSFLKKPEDIKISRTRLDNILNALQDRTAILSSLGRVILEKEKRGFDGQPVKTVFIYFDPYSEKSRDFLRSHWPDKFYKKGVRSVFIPVALRPDSLNAGLFFLKTGLYRFKGEPLAAQEAPEVCCGEENSFQKCHSLIKNNNIFFNELKPEGYQGGPIFFFPVAKTQNSMNYRRFHGDMTEAVFEKIVNNIEAISYRPYDGYYTLTTGEPVAACLKRKAEEN